MHLGLHCLDIGERIGETHRASGDGHSDIKKWDAERSAAAFVLPVLPASAATNSGRVGVILHVPGRIRFGIGEHFSGRVDDGGARARRLAFLRRDFREGVRTRSLSTRCANSRVF